MKNIREYLEEKHCYNCEHFYEGTICIYELTSDREKENIYDVMYKRKDTCKLDKEPVHLRKQIYSGLELEGKLLDTLLSRLKPIDDFEMIKKR